MDWYLNRLVNIIFQYDYGIIDFYRFFISIIGFYQLFSENTNYLSFSVAR